MGKIFITLHWDYLLASKCYGIFFLTLGADIANVCNEAAIYAGTHDKPSVSMADIDFALQKIIGGTEKRSYVRDAREKKINAYYEAGRAVVSWLTRTSDAILKVSLIHH